MTGSATVVGASGAVLSALGPGRLHHGTAWLSVAACAAAAVPSGLRWLRVAQREHYLPGSVSRFAGRWWWITAANRVLAAVAVAALLVTPVVAVAGVVVACVVAVGPLGLSVRGRTSPLAWTRRLRSLAAVSAVLVAAVIGIGVAIGPAAPVAALAAVSVPFLVDLACLVTAPVERRLGTRFVEEARRRLSRVDPTIVAVTGSYGKTSTKGHIAHLVGPTRTVVATPASFNNRAGLARAVNEHLADGTEVFVAEMGTYGPGEIADLCRWCPPDIAVITAIGPVHLERFGSEERIVEAKSEILEAAGTAVLAADDPRLAAVADRAAAAGKDTRRCSADDPAADVCVQRSPDGATVTVWLGGTVVAEGVPVPVGTQPSNLACAVAVAVALGVAPQEIGGRLATLPSVDHRLQAARAGSGALVLDDTYNANPAGAAEALGALVQEAPGAAGEAGRPQRRVVVTPGMVELGRCQYEENERFGAAVAAVADDLVVVGRTNRRALVAGASDRGRSLAITLVEDRDRAVQWVRERLGPGDVVLYENDLPDHYP